MYTTAEYNAICNAIANEPDHLDYSDQDYRDQAAQGLIPQAVQCSDCDSPATFRDDVFAARYECLDCGHAIAAMWAAELTPCYYMALDIDAETVHYTLWTEAEF